MRFLPKTLLGAVVLSLLLVALFVYLAEGSERRIGPAPITSTR